MQERVDQITGKASKVITPVSSTKQMNPRISIKDDRGRTLKLPDGELAARYLLPVGSIITVSEHDIIAAGTVIAKIPRETTKTKDITGGLPRVADLFEARRPKDHAIMAEMTGYEYADIIVLEGGHNLVALDMIMQRIASHIASTD